MDKKFTKRIFTVDDETLFEGYSDGTTWNGWSCPWFTKEVALTIATELNHWAGEGSLVYDADTDAFIEDVQFIEHDKDTVETYEGKDIDVDGTTMKLYPIGGSIWIWTEVE